MRFFLTTALLLSVARGQCCSSSETSCIDTMTVQPGWNKACGWPCAKGCDVKLAVEATAGVIQLCTLDNAGFEPLRGHREIGVVPPSCNGTLSSGAAVTTFSASGRQAAPDDDVYIVVFCQHNASACDVTYDFDVTPITSPWAIVGGVVAAVAIIVFVPLGIYCWKCSMPTGGGGGYTASTTAGYGGISTYTRKSWHEGWNTPVTRVTPSERPAGGSRYQEWA